MCLLWLANMFVEFEFWTRLRLVRHHIVVWWWLIKLLTRECWLNSTYMYVAAVLFRAIFLLRSNCLLLRKLPPPSRVEISSRRRLLVLTTSWCVVSTNATSCCLLIRKILKCWKRRGSHPKHVILLFNFFVFILSFTWLCIWIVVGLLIPVTWLYLGYE